MNFNEKRIGLVYKSKYGSSRRYARLKSKKIIVVAVGRVRCGRKFIKLDLKDKKAINPILKCISAGSEGRSRTEV